MSDPVADLMTGVDGVELEFREPDVRGPSTSGPPVTKDQGDPELSAPPDDDEDPEMTKED